MLTFEEHLNMRMWDLGLAKRWKLGHIELIRTKNKKIECFSHVGFILN